MSGVYPVAPERVTRGASLSNDGLYRYSLTREWGAGGFTYPAVTFIMLNPATADAELDDPTIRRCVGFTRTLGFCALRVVNLYAYRATDPADLWRAAEPTGGRRNDDVLTEVGRRARTGEPLIAAWGAQAKADRVQHVLGLPGWDHLVALGTTKTGAPRHPLYLPRTSLLRPWPRSAAA